ncbi:hypothetical protein CPB84DRAFT_1791544 [Gymnopilus junonius]|uniref:Uncharacterized protein n=1 Tax=Gymnopilus junonius TaxID=109634 RepID=A0A9P5NDQ8_GYMJU|nr:hypothetical protein CPB84DRAFT_1791544 [Gymnopilus junonius]
MYYPSSAGTVTSFVTPHYPVSRSYYPAAPMSAVLPATAAPVMMAQPAYGAMPYYGHTPTVIMPSRSGRHRHSSRSRSRSRGFLGYL